MYQVKTALQERQEQMAHARSNYEQTLAKALSKSKKPSKDSIEAIVIKDELEKLGFSPFICYANWTWPQIKEAIDNPNNRR